MSIFNKNSFFYGFFKLWLLAATVSVVTISLPFYNASAESVLTIDSDRQFDFAQYYFNKGDYPKAVVEYQRFVYFFPTDNRVESALFKCGMSYFYGRRFNDAVFSFSEVIDRFHDSKLAVRSYLMIGECHLAGNAFGSAIITLHNLIKIVNDPDMKDEAYYRLGWVYIEMASWEDARISFAEISDQNKDSYKLEKLSHELDKAKLIPGKDPKLAGILSIVPGGGQLYVERYQDALIAFLVNAGLILAAYESFDKELYALGGLIAFVEVGFYAGNIYSAVSGAHKYNNKTSNKLIENLKKNVRINISADKTVQKVLLSLKYAF